MMISCDEFVEQVTTYLEGDAPMGERLKFMFHKAMCGHCRRYFEQIKVTRDLLKYVPATTANPELVEALLQKYRTLEADPEIELPDEV